MKLMMNVKMKTIGVDDNKHGDDAITQFLVNLSGKGCNCFLLHFFWGVLSLPSWKGLGLEGVWWWSHAVVDEQVICAKTKKALETSVVTRCEAPGLCGRKVHWLFGIIRWIILFTFHLYCWDKGYTGILLPGDIVHQSICCLKGRWDDHLPHQDFRRFQQTVHQTRRSG